MSTLSERIPILVTPEQRELLDGIARREGTSIGAVVREAIGAYLGPPRRPRQEALAELYSLNAPVADWPEIKAEIITGAVEGEPDDILGRLRTQGQDGG